MAIDVKAALVRDLRAGTLIVFVGTGVPLAATSNNPLASWTGLIEDGIKTCRALDKTLSQEWEDRALEDLYTGDLDDLLATAEKVERKLNAPRGGDYSRWLRGSVGSLKATSPDVPSAVVALGAPILTTNYDSILDDLLPGGSPATWRSSNRIQRIVRGEERSVGHLHGHWQDPQSVILGIRSYDRIESNQFAQAIQAALGVAKSILFVGVGRGLEDPNWTAWHAAMTSFAVEGSETMHYRLCRAGEEAELSAARGRSPVYPVSFGERFDELGPFLRELATEAGMRRVGSEGAGYSDPHKSSEVRVAIAVIVREKQVVLVQRRRREADLEWQFPAGFVNPGRDAREAVCEDVKEETGLTCRVVDFFGERIHPTTKIRCVYYKMSILDGSLINGDSSENLDARWVDTDRIHDFVDAVAIFEPVLRSLEQEAQ